MNASPLRLTRRGRTVLVLLLMSLLLAAFSLGRSDSQAATEAAARPVLATTTVHGGETLWQVAQRIAPGTDPRSVVAQLKALNHLEGSVQAGQQLLLPAQG